MLSYAKNAPNSCGPRVEMIFDSPGESEFIAWGSRFPPV